jgi:hypothetical protein
LHLFSGRGLVSHAILLRTRTRPGMRQQSRIRTSTQLLDSVLEEMSSFTRTLILGGNASTFARAHVCPYCLFFPLAGEICKDVPMPTTKYDSYSVSSLYNVLGGPSSKTNKMGWLAVAAAAHNKEQHALNGNIDSVLDQNYTPLDQYLAYKTAFWGGQCVSLNREYCEADLIRRAVETSPRTFFTDGPNSYHTAMTNLGTMYQFIVYSKEIGEMLGGLAGEEDARMSPDGTATPVATPGVLLPHGRVFPGIPGLSGTRSTLTLRTTPSDDSIKGSLGGLEEGKGKQKMNTVMSTALSKIRSVLRLRGEGMQIDNESDTPMPPPPAQPPVDEKLAQEVCERIARKVRWVSVGVDNRFCGGSMEYTTYGSSLVDKTPIIYGLVSNVPHLTQICVQTGNSQPADIRELALKVALIDMQREQFFSQPSGVEWAWARAEMPKREIIDLSSMGYWHYDAVFVTTELIDYALRDGGWLPVGSGDGRWRIREGSVRIIGLPHNSNTQEMGRNMWILSHLTHPLAWIFDYYSMSRIGEQLEQEEVFCHTAGLVDMHCGFNRLIFVTPTKTNSSISLGGKSFPVNNVDTHLNYGEGRRPYVWNVDNQILHILNEALQSTTSLRRDFDQYCIPMITSSINWLEVDSLVNLLTVRYHQRIEGVQDDMVHALGAPRQALIAMGLNPCDVVRQNSYRDYGGVNAVTALDHRVSSKRRARQNAAVKIGAWTNLAELAVTIQICYYNPHNTVDVRANIQRLDAGNLDKLQRSRALRASLELWKKRVCILDMVAFPMHGFRREWSELIVSPNVGKGQCVSELADAMLGLTVKLNWSINWVLGCKGTTMTGMRLSSAQWRHEFNTLYIPYNPTEETGESEGTAKYVLGMTPSCWSFNKLYQNPRQGGRCDKLEFALCRLNLVERKWNLTYQNQASATESCGIVFCIDSSAGVVVAHDVGFKGTTDITPPTRNWSWGVKTCINDFVTGQMYTLVIGLDVWKSLNSGEFELGTLLFTGRDSPLSANTNVYVRRPMDDLIIEKLKAMRLRPGDGVAVRVLSDADRLEKIAQLKAELAALEEMG